MSAAETIRRAVAQIRNDHGGPISRHTRDGRRWLPVGDWLEHVADRLDHRDLCREMGVPVSPGEVRRSLAVAQTYLGEQP